MRRLLTLPMIAIASAALTACASSPVREIATPAEPLTYTPRAHSAPYPTYAPPLVEVPDLPFREPLQLTPKDRACLVAVMYYEAHGEGEKGMEAVGHVVLNRLHERPEGTTVCDVVYEKKQFGWTRRISRKKVAIGKTPAWKSAAQLADRLIAGYSEDKTRGATAFYSVFEFRDGPPEWVENDEKAVQIGNHVFVAP
ncbi:cell wall hydrolase [Parvibaculum sp.]|uniref:cell wall hydrolase n=1 Tax=Parvibaculum sp. TaxID=2024848 RepID=UPI0032116CDF